MKIAVTYQSGNVFQHFGHTEEFKIYDIDNNSGKIISSRVVSANGFGHESLVLWLNLNAVNSIICGGIGGGAQKALANAGIGLYAGVTGSADAAVEALLNNTLEYQTTANCSHHDHENGHECGDTCGH